jgi:hypothetical protein
MTEPEPATESPKPARVRLSVPEQIERDRQRLAEKEQRMRKELAMRAACIVDDLNKLRARATTAGVVELADQCAAAANSLSVTE